MSRNLSRTTRMSRPDLLADVTIVLVKPLGLYGLGIILMTLPDARDRFSSEAPIKMVSEDSKIDRV